MDSFLETFDVCVCRTRDRLYELVTFGAPGDWYWMRLEKDSILVPYLAIFRTKIVVDRVGGCVDEWHMQIVENERIRMYRTHEPQFVYSVPFSAAQTVVAEVTSRSYGVVFVDAPVSVPFLDDPAVRARLHRFVAAGERLDALD